MSMYVLPICYFIFYFKFLYYFILFYLFFFYFCLSILCNALHIFLINFFTKYLFRATQAHITPPSFTKEAAHEILSNLYKLNSLKSLSTLPSERDQNFLVVSGKKRENSEEEE